MRKKKFKNKAKIGNHLARRKLKQTKLSKVKQTKINLNKNKGPNKIPLPSSEQFFMILHND